MPFLIMEGDESLDALGNQYADLGKYAAEKMHKQAEEIRRKLSEGGAS